MDRITMTKMKTMTITIAIALLIGMTVSAEEEPQTTKQEDTGTQNAAPPEKMQRMIERRAQDILRQMSDFLAATPRFAFEAEETFDELVENQPRIELTNIRKVAVERPARFISDAGGDTLNRSVWFDGRTVASL